MEVRLLKPADAKSYWILRLEALKQNPEAFSTSYEDAVKREKPVEQIIYNLKTDGVFTFGAFDENCLVGVVTLVHEKAIKLQHRATIYAVYVTSEKQGLGIGEALLREAIHTATTIDEIEKINVSVVSSNEKAIGLYTKLGFKTFGIEEKAIKINNDYFVEEHMVLFLK